MVRTARVSTIKIVQIAMKFVKSTLGLFVLVNDHVSTCMHPWIINCMPANELY